MAKINNSGRLKPIEFKKNEFITNSLGYYQLNIAGMTLRMANDPLNDGSYSKDHAYLNGYALTKDGDKVKVNLRILSFK